MNATESVLTKRQVKVYPSETTARTVTLYGKKHYIRAFVRYDDQCGNGHNTFSITGEYWEAGRSKDSGGGGCCHEEITKAFPELAPFIKWHLVSSDGPLHYIANTIYHATEHGPKSAWVYHKAFKVTPPGGGKGFSLSENCLKYCDIEEANAIVASNPEIYFLKIDEKTAKIANLEHARSSAIWPEATQAQLLDKAALMARHPALMAEFRTAVESLGFVY